MTTELPSSSNPLPIIDISVKTPLYPTKQESASIGLQDEVKLEQDYWTWKPRSFRISIMPIFVGTIYIIMPIVCYVVGKEYKSKLEFLYLVIFSGAPLPFLICLGIVSAVSSCGKPSYGILKELVVVLLSISVIVINAAGLSYFDFQFNELPILRIFPIMVEIFTSIFAIVMLGVFFTYRSIAKKVILSNKLETFIHNFEKQGKKEDCSFYFSKIGCM